MPSVKEKNTFLDFFPSPRNSVPREPRRLRASSDTVITRDNLHLLRNLHGRMTGQNGFEGTTSPVLIPMADPAPNEIRRIWDRFEDPLEEDDNDTEFVLSYELDDGDQYKSGLNLQLDGEEDEWKPASSWAQQPSVTPAEKAEEPRGTLKKNQKPKSSSQTPPPTVSKKEKSQKSRGKNKSESKDSKNQSDQYTTCMLRNIPNKYSPKMLVDQLHDRGFLNCYDFLYLPIDFQNKCNMGYAFINFRSHRSYLDFVEKFEGFPLPGFLSKKVCGVVPARMQGLDANVKHFVNSPIMDHVSDSCKPLLLDENNKVIPFPTQSDNESKKKNHGRRKDKENGKDWGDWSNSWYGGSGNSKKGWKNRKAN